jgi:dCTP deaminase
MSDYSLLNNRNILDYRAKGEIIIEPFNMKQLNTASYDVTMGPWFFREQPLDEDWGSNSNIYNIYSEEHVKRIWGEPQRAKPYSYYREKGILLENVFDDDEIIFIDPGERILAHTNEMIGGRTTVTAMMKSRSSAGRNFISCCSCSGYSDIGYINYWTMEISNLSDHFRIPLVVGRRYAQIVFFETGETLGKSLLYHKRGKYQTSDDPAIIAQTWSPYDVLPKMYKDYEITDKPFKDKPSI